MGKQDGQWSQESQLAETSVDEPQEGKVGPNACTCHNWQGQVIVQVPQICAQSQ
jgi:hypothetical protein